MWADKFLHWFWRTALFWYLSSYCTNFLFLADLGVQAGWLSASRKNCCSLTPVLCVGGQRSEEELSCVAGLVWSGNGLDLRPSHHHLLRLVTGSEKQSINNSFSSSLNIDKYINTSSKKWNFLKYGVSGYFPLLISMVSGDCWLDTYIDNKLFQTPEEISRSCWGFQMQCLLNPGEKICN